MCDHEAGAAASFRRLMPLLHASGLFAITALVLAGVGESIVREGTLPGIRFGYSDQHSRLVEAGDYSSAIPELRTAALLDFDNASAQTQLLKAAYSANDAENASRAIRGLLQLAPHDPELHAKLAGLLLDLGEAEQATVHSRYATQLAPDSANYHCLHGTALLTTARLADAAAAFRRALKLDAESIPAKQALAFPLKGY